MSCYLKPREMEIINNHYNKYFTMAGAKPSGIVIHQNKDNGIHIDIEHYLPTDEFPYHIFATVGMSAYKMKDVPHKRIELIMFLPRDWKTDEQSLKNDEWSWPINLLLNTACMPYQCNSCLSYAHTISYSDEFSPFADCTEMCCGLVTFPTYLDHGIFNLRYGILPHKKVNFYCLTTITKEEFDKSLIMGRSEFIENELSKNEEEDDLVVRNYR